MSTNLREEISYFNDNNDEIRNVSNLISYQGFNPTEFKVYLRTFEENEKIFEKDIVQIIAIYLGRGTKSEKMSTKISENGKTLLTHLIRKYKIVSTLPKKKEEVTFARVAASYPVICALSLKNGYGRIVGDKSDCPTSLCFPSAASIIPKTRTDLLEKWKNWRANFSQTIKSKVDATFDDIIINSSLYSESERIEIIRKLEVWKEQ